LSFEYVGNLHIHTVYSDGAGTHQQVAAAALQAGLDFVVVTDHNVWVQGVEGYHFRDGRQLLLLTGEEIHDPGRDPQKNHLLAYACGQEFARWAPEPQRLIRAIRQAEGLSFVAHPVDPPAPRFGLPDLSWEAGALEGISGLEIWNFMSEFKSRLSSPLAAVWHAFRPAGIARGPFPQVLRWWDEVLATGTRWTAIGNADAHAQTGSLGPLSRVVFPYAYLFRTVNTHVLCPQPWTADPATDGVQLYAALRDGACFVGYDLPHSTRGFRFTATDDRGPVIMGGSARARFGVTLQIHSPRVASIRLFRNGERIRVWRRAQSAVHVAHEPGAYRVEVHLPVGGGLRSWIFSNPIHVAR
jgi:hypothetical protein